MNTCMRMKLIKKNGAPRIQYYDEEVPFRGFISKIFVCGKFGAKTKICWVEQTFQRAPKTLSEPNLTFAEDLHDIFRSFLLLGCCFSNKSSKFC